MQKVPFIFLNAVAEVTTMPFTSNNVQDACSTDDRLADVLGDAATYPDR